MFLSLLFFQCNTILNLSRDKKYNVFIIIKFYTLIIPKNIHMKMVKIKNQLHFKNYLEPSLSAILSSLFFFDRDLFSGFLNTMYTFTKNKKRSSLFRWHGTDGAPIYRILAFFLIYIDILYTNSFDKTADKRWRRRENPI